VWESKQEMLFEMIESCIQDWIAKQPVSDKAAAEFDHQARRSLQHGMGADRSEDSATEM
jgi:hypothetical protein